MLKRIAAIGFIFVCTTAAWVALGGAIFSRTYSSGSSLDGKVASSWGTAQEQWPPLATYRKPVENDEVTIQEGRRTVRRTTTYTVVPLPLESSRIKVALELEHRKKGLLWYSAYKVDFAGAYSFRNSSDAEQEVRFRLNYPAEHAVYDDLTFTLDGQVVATQQVEKGIEAVARIAAGKTVVFRTAYRSQGLDSWRYNFAGSTGSGVAQVRDFELRMKTDFKAIDVPENALSPTGKQATPEGWDLTWNYKNLVTGFQIGMPMPEKLQPGPLAGRISFFAPVSLLFFFFVVMIVTTLRGIYLHPMNYFFLAAAFFAFHLLLAYTVDLVPIHLAFLLCSAVSIFLVVSYLRLVAGPRFAFVEAGLAQFIYLVLFSYAFFFEGMTGLAITIGAILTLFVAMQLTAKVRWAEKFGVPLQAS